MTGDKLDDLAQQVMRGVVAIDDLPEVEQDAVIMRTYELAADNVDDPRIGEACQQIVDSLQDIYDDIMCEGAEAFTESIVEAEKRGSVFCAPQTFMLH